MWSGPRNISTAMMRSWGNRPDTTVTDEPLYAHYLKKTGLPHPAREATLAAHETDWKKVTEWLIGPIPDDKPVWYQKHMAHHLLPDVGTEWMEDVTHAFLIREPSAMLVSLTEFIPNPHLTDTGLPQQLQIFEYVKDALGMPPPVVDGNDILRDPRGVLTRLCTALGLPFHTDMLKWPPGIRNTDGAWASEWYAKVAETTGFGPPRDDAVEVPAELAGLHDECLAIYNALAKHKL